MVVLMAASTVVMMVELKAWQWAEKKAETKAEVTALMWAAQKAEMMAE